MKACARFDEILSVGYLSNGLSIFDVKSANLAPPWSSVYGREDRRAPLFILDFQRGSDNDNLCKVLWISIGGIFFKWTSHVLDVTYTFSNTILRLKKV